MTTFAEPTEREWLLHPETGHELTREFDVDGWTYATETDDEDDNRKLYHFLVCPEACLFIDWTPYARMTPTDVHAWLKLGCPKRQGIRPLNTMDLLHLAVERASRAEKETR